jgi:ABC-2 type transport system permease protein
MQRFLTLTKALFLIYIRERSTLFWNFAFPVFLLVIYAAIFGGEDVSRFMGWMMPGVLAINVLAFGLISSSTMMTEFRQKGVLRRIQASPAPALTLVGAYILVNIAIATLQAGLVIAVGVFIYGVQMPLANVLLALPLMLVAVLMSIALGQVVSGIAPGAGGAVAVGQILYFGQMFITDLIMPIEQMPAWVQTVGPWLPGYAIAQLVRPPLQTGVLGPHLAANLVLALAYGLVAALLAARLFKWEARS